ncbi:MAG: GDP-mannose 4,6-dehydratase, partial [Candidatus Aenigmatarchaeota archaeon]
YPYDASKACTDILARCYHKTFGLPVAVTRLANVYGGADFHFDRIVPGTIVSVLKGETPIIRSDGKPERDYMYIDDAVSAYLTLAENLDRKEVQGEAFNFGTGKVISVLDFFNTIIRLCGKSVRPKVLNEAKTEIIRQYLDSTKAKKMLGWEAKVPLEEGLKKTIEWYKNYLKEKK